MSTPALWLALTLSSFPVIRTAQIDRAAAARLGELRAEALANPYDGGVFASLGFALREAGDLPGASAAFASAVELGGGHWRDLWNLACLQAVQGQDEAALATIERSLDAGLTDDGLLLRDPDLGALRADPRFHALTGLFPPAGLTRDEGWRFDLAFLEKRMERMHWDLHAHVSEAEWKGTLTALAAEIPDLTEAQVRARLARLIARIGDGHTLMRSSPEGATTVTRFPLELHLFRDGLYVIAAPRALAALVGGRVRALGNVPVERALLEMRPYLSVDNEMGYRDWAPSALTSPDLLEALGAVPPEEPLDLELVHADGRRERTFVERVEQSPQALAHGSLGRTRAPGWTYALDDARSVAAGALPLYLQHPETTLWFHDLPEQRLVYLWFGAVADPPGRTLEQACRELFAHLAEVGAERLVIDMRLNDGGNTGLILPLIHGLVRCEAVNRPGHLFVITGRRTFSAAMNACSLLELHTAATFVGEPTGSRPNFVGESTSFVLPCTRYRVYASSRYWQHVSSTDTRPWIAPSLVAEPSFADYLARRDPALDAILARLR